MIDFDQVTFRERRWTMGWLKRLLPPSAPPANQIPKAILQAGLFGLITGPFLGVFFGWSGPIRAAVVGATYGVVFYTICALPSGYVRRYLVKHPTRKVKAAVILTGLAGMLLASVAIFVIFHPPSLNLQFVQVWVVLAILALAWGQLVTSREFLEAEKDLAAARAYTKVLQARMNPHFFFNTLNTISALIPEDASSAQRMLGLMADMSRYTFASAEVEVAPLARELEFARAYLEIEQMRFGERLRCELPDDSSVEGLSLPVFTLQPLIENAVRHGISPRMDGGAIAVRVHRNGTSFSLSVENDTADVDLSESNFFKRGHALHNIRERLGLIYRGRASLQVNCHRENTLTITIETPVELIGNDLLHHC